MSDRACCSQHCKSLLKFPSFVHIAKSEIVIFFRHFFIKHSYQLLILLMLSLKVANNLFVNEV